MSAVRLLNDYCCSVEQCSVLYLASSSRGVSAHLVVRVVVTAFESAAPDTAGSSESSDSSRADRSRVLKPRPGEMVVRNIRWQKVANEVMNLH